MSSGQFSTMVYEQLQNNITIANSFQNYQLLTNYYKQFLFVNDSMNFALNANVTSGALIAFCNGAQLAVGAGYFKATQCTQNLTIFNTINNVTLYQLPNVANLSLVYTVKLNRTQFATIFFQRSKNLTSDYFVYQQFNVTQGQGM